MVFGSLLDCENLKKKEGEDLVVMGKEVEDVEEGEISDTASVEEISEEDFNKQDSVKVNNNNNNNNNSNNKKQPKGGVGGDDARVWAVRDLYSKYPNICRGYASGLYNLAWAQAVQNKPLNDIFVMEIDSDATANNAIVGGNPSLNRSSSGTVGVKKNVGEVVILDVDKEEGELEEGEIDADADPEAVVSGTVQNVVEEDGVVASETVFSNSEKFSVREVLEGVTVANVEESFNGACSRLQSALKSMPEVVSGLGISKKDGLACLSFKAIEVVYSVFFSMDNLRREQYKDNILSLLSFVKDQLAHLFSVEHMKEIWVMITAVNSIGAIGDSEATDKEKKLVTNETKTKEIPAVRDGELVSSSKPLTSDSIGVLEALKSGQSNIKLRGLQLPLLDLHKDHDLDSLPSPTREAPSCIPVNKAFSVGAGVVGAGLPPAKMESVKMELDNEVSKFRHYETDALKAVSTYQQKFGRNSLFTTDKLPSPTPSGDGESGVADTTEEVSSASIGASLGSTKPSLLEQPPVSSTSMDRSSMHGLINSRIDTPVSGSYPVKTSAKSRDPRLRFINSDSSALDPNQPSSMHSTHKAEHGGMIMSRKQKAVEEPSLDVAVTKRLRSSSENLEHNTRELRTAAGNGGWLEENSMVGSQLIERNHLMENVDSEPKKAMSTVSSSCTVSGNSNATSNGGHQQPLVSSTATASLPALLKDIAVNPSMLLSIIMEQQQKLAAEAKKKSADSSMGGLHLSSAIGATGTDPNVSTGPSMTSGLQQKAIGVLPVSSQVTSTAQSLQQDDPGKIRMKPRDPRRILHSNTLQKSGSASNEQFKAIVSPVVNKQGIGDNVSAQKLEDRADTKLTPSSIAPPDIARQFTRNLKNIADIICVSQEPSNQSPAPQNFSSASVLTTSDRAEPKSIVSNSQNLQAGTGSVPETCASAASRPQSTWGDVEHLFEGYDEQQKAAIQRERARRIEEQNKMFAARKLCLVLDLDHTLLNSAKFVEVDPVHDEILRKKEQEDREKPQRHLFRFPHMAMWTKLRPGIWNFLEKASKLYELHLYTMGNKLYATEMAKVLDPKGVLFNGRVISRGDDADSSDGDERAPKSKDLEGVLGMESAVVIIDDSVRVWPHNKLNLIVVERYIYFPCSRRQFGLPGPSLLEIDHDERPEAGTLASSLAVIERIHQNFFCSPSLEEVDVRNILASEQRKILASCRIVFSRVFPVGETNPHLHPLWQTAEQFGAVCTNQIDEQVTHVVANSLGTDKVNWALNNGRFVVHPGWVEASALLYRRANEQDFAIKQ